MRQNVTRVSVRFNLNNPDHAEIVSILKDLNKNFHTSQSAFIIEALTYYIRNVSDSTLTNGGEERYNERQREFATREYRDYIANHPELNEDQKKMLQLLMEEQTSIYGGGSDIGQNVVQLGMTKLGCHYSQARRYDEGYYDCSSFVMRMYREF